MRTALVATAVAASLISAGTTGVVGASARIDEPLLKDLRAATARFHSLAQAKDAGYVQGSPCEASPRGGMGFHYINPALMANPAIDPFHPEILLYEPKKNGQLRLVGVEYLTFDADQSLATDNDRPFLGVVPFEGPMPGHTPQMPVHYDLHVWLFKENPDGVYATWNPDVTC